MAKKQKNGLYRSKVKVGVDADGRDIFKWYSGKTRKEFEQARQEVIARYIDGTALQDDQLFGSYAVTWFNVRKKPHIKDGSIENYRTALNKDILPVFGDRNLRAIQPAEIQEFLNGFSGKSASKITYVVATLHGIFTAAHNDRIISFNPTAALIKPEATAADEKRALTEAERKRVEAVCLFDQNGAYLACMYYLGVRPGEARGLMWKDFDWDAGLVHIQRDIDYKAGGAAGALKTAAANRRIPIPDILRKILCRKRGQPEEFLFIGERSGRPLAKTTAERLWIKLMLACDMVIPLQEGANNYRKGDIRSQYKAIITPHTMRHNYITMCWENGIDPFITMKLVGHESIQTTLDIYTHLTEKLMQRAVASVGDMFSPENNSEKNVAQKLQQPTWYSMMK